MGLLAAIVALLLILGFNMAFTRGFMDFEVRDGRAFGSLILIPNRAAPIAIVALGMTLVIATGGVDLSVGAVMAISGALAGKMLADGHSMALAIGVPLAVCALAGLWNGILVAYLQLQPIVATLILMVSGRGIAQLINQGQIPSISSEPFSYIGGGYFVALPFSITLAVFMLAATALLTRRTALGLFIEAVGNNATASRYAGINANLVKVLAYVFAGVCAGIAGLIIASQVKASDANNAGLYMELDAILAVVIGGTALSGGRFSLIGSMVGALIIQSLTTTILTRGIPAQWTPVVKALVVLAVCLLQSEAFRRKAVGRLRRRNA